MNNKNKPEIIRNHTLKYFEHNRFEPTDHLETSIADLLRLGFWEASDLVERMYEVTDLHQERCAQASGHSRYLLEMGFEETERVMFEGHLKRNEVLARTCGEEWAEHLRKHLYIAHF